MSNGLVLVTRIDKNRKSFALGDFEINVDNVKSLGEFIEVQLMSENVDLAQKEIENILLKLGILKEHFINKGYVPLMLEEQSRINKD